MAAHTLIIDLFGVPACGKTTLSDYLYNNCFPEKKVVTMPNLVKESKKEPIKLLFSLSIGRMIKGFILRLKAPFNNQRKDINVFGWPSHARYYSFAKKHSNYDIVLCDHGDIQDFVSLERGENLHTKKRFAEACFNYINTSDASVYVYCDVDVEVAFERIRKRGRNSGRIDVIEDDQKQLDELRAEKMRFDFYSNWLKQSRKKYIQLDMNQSTEEIANSLVTRVQQL